MFTLQIGIAQEQLQNYAGQVERLSGLLSNHQPNQQERTLSANTTSFANSPSYRQNVTQRANAFSAISAAFMPPLLAPVTLPLTQDAFTTSILGSDNPAGGQLYRAVDREHQRLLDDTFNRFRP